jgi:hypothetical protein
LSFLTAIEEYKAEISSQDILVTSDEDISKLPPNELRDKEHVREEVMKAIDVLNFVEDSMFFPTAVNFINFMFFYRLERRNH